MLTPAQNNAFQQIKEKIDHNAQRTFLLHGVTGSGKLKSICKPLKKY